MPDRIIQTEVLTKHYGNFHAVEQLSCRVRSERITGFLGRNGAGKSSTIKMLLGMIRPTSGHGTVLGLPIDDPKASIEIRKKIAYVGEDKGLYGYMTVEQLIWFTRSFYPDWRPEVEKKLLSDYRLPPNRKSKLFRRECALSLRCCLRFPATRLCLFSTSLLKGLTRCLLKSCCRR